MVPVADLPLVLEPTLPGKRGTEQAQGLAAACGSLQEGVLPVLDGLQDLVHEAHLHPVGLMRKLDLVPTYLHRRISCPDLAEHSLLPSSCFIAYYPADFAGAVSMHTALIELNDGKVGVMLDIGPSKPFSCLAITRGKFVPSLAVIQSLRS